MDDLEAALRRRMRGPDRLVPAAVDAAILDAAREAASGFRRRHRLRLWGGASVAAAVLALAAWLGFRFLAPAADVFDVADAWRVAAGLEHDGARYDLNGDGRLDRADADLMLGRIVALEPRRGS